MCEREIKKVDSYVDTHTHTHTQTHTHTERLNKKKTKYGRLRKQKEHILCFINIKFKKFQS